MLMTIAKWLVGLGTLGASLIAPIYLGMMVYDCIGDIKRGICKWYVVFFLIIGLFFVTGIGLAITNTVLEAFGIL